MNVTTYPVGAVWYAHTSPDHGYGVLDGFNWGIGASVRAVHPTLHLDVDGLAFPVLQESQPEREQKWSSQCFQQKGIAVASGDGQNTSKLS